VIVCFVDNGGIDDQKESLNSNGNQFHQYRQIKQSPLILTH
jgi:hypothetical protein